MPTTRPVSAARRGLVLIAAALAPALIAPSAAVAAAGAVPAQGPTGASQVVTSPSSSAPSSVTQAAAGVAGDIRQPQLDGVPLSGVNRVVKESAPDPTVQEPGAMSALSTDQELKLAVAAEVRISTPAALVAVTADEDFAEGTSIQVRVEEKDHGWSGWTSLQIDPDSEEAERARPGSEPLLATEAVKAQVRIDTPSGTAPSGTELVIVDSPTARSDRTISAQSMSAQSMSAQSMSAQSMSASSTVGMPSIVTRSQWGADESWRSRAPYYTDNIRAGFIHHTASTSNYTAAQAASQLRAIYAYHTKSLGHSDIDYNFVVDKYGRLYEGRYGGMDRAVLGGHTAGFNEHTFAAVVLGNFDSSTVPSAKMAAIRESLARLFAWKLGLSGINPASTVKLVSAGFSRPIRYSKGTVATLTATTTHRTVNYTACPGRYLQDEVPKIIALGAKYSNVVISAPSPAVESFQSGSRNTIKLTSSSTRAVKWTADVLSPCSDRPIRSYSGSTSGAAGLSLSWDLKDAHGDAVLPATYTVRMSGTDSSGSAVAVVSSTVTVTPSPGGAWGPCANASRVSGDSAAATSVLWGRISAPSSRVVVLTGEADESRAALSAGVSAAPLARSLNAPLLMTPVGSLSAEVAADIVARKATEVIVVGGNKVISPEAFDDVAELGVPVTRLTGGSMVGTAVVVAERMGTDKPAILVSTKGSPAHSLAGAALAAARGVPVLLGATGALPSDTVAALAGRPSVTVAAPAGVLSDADINAAIPRRTWNRLTGPDAVTASIAVERGFPGTPTSVMVLPESSKSWQTAPLAASAGVPVLFTTSPVLAPAVADLLGARPDLRAATTTVSSWWLDDQVLGATSRLLLGRAWAPPGVPVQPPEASPTGEYRLGRTNAKPEPVRKGSTLLVKAKVQVKFTDGTWRKVPKGVAFILAHRPSGKKYRPVASGYTLKARARVTVTARTSGVWRIKIGKRIGHRDYVRVIG